MSQSDELRRENEILRERLSRLSEAGLRINRDLDLDTVLKEVVDGARSVTGARLGSITVLDESGQLQNFITSGLTPEEHRMFVELPGGSEFFAYLSSLSEPLRLSNFSAYTTALGLPEIGPPLGPVGSFLGAPIRHGDQHIGNFYISDKQGSPEFTQEDEDTLVMFASQAATAISNARTHRDEQRARADLETLVNISPVGVVVIDAKTGFPVSVNPEARRIGDALRDRDQSDVELLRSLTLRRADRRDISLRESPLAAVLSSGESVEAEEMVVEAPGGRTIPLIVNATPIPSEDGEIETMMVTIQDMTRLEELERLRAEFLATVSHELRAPLTSIKGSAATVLDSDADLDPALVRQFFRIIGDQADHMHSLVADLLDVARIETGTLAVSPEPAEVAVLVDRARNSFTGAGGRNNLAIDIEQGLPLVMADRRRIVQVLGNLLSNAARHSQESSAIRVSATRDGVHVVFSVADEGRGIPSERLPHLFRKFSRIDAEDQGGNTGLGLAICKGIVEAHGGRIRAESDGPGLGARFSFSLPTVDEAASSPRPSTRLPQRGAVAAGGPVRVLAVDDDPQDLRYVRDALAKANYTPIVTGDPGEALRLMEERRPGLVLLDLMLPGTNGIDLMKDILTIADVPVIFLSAYGQEELIVRAFHMGAADYVVKPFSPSELAARIGAALRKREEPEPSEPYVLGDLTVDYAERRVTLAGRPVDLMAIEYRMLTALSTNGGRVVTYERLLQRVWGERSTGDLRSMRTIVRNLRRKLGDDVNSPTYIFTESRVGYRMPQGETRETE